LSVVDEMLLGYNPVKPQELFGDDFHMPDLCLDQAFIHTFGHTFDIAVCKDDGDHTKGHSQGA